MSELNEKIWTPEGKLDPAVRDHLLKIAGKFFEYIKIKQPVDDIILTGSMANYNWTSKSDLDLHLVIDYSKIDKDIDLIKEYMLAHKSNWNEDHQIKIKGFPIEVYVQDSSEPLYAGGVYSILKNEWVKKPSREKHDVDQKAIEHKAKPIEYDIDKAIEDSDYEKLVSISEKLREMRKAALEKDGEFSLENLVFKYLRNNGYLEKLSNAKTKILDKQLSLEHQMSLSREIRKIADHINSRVYKLDGTFKHPRADLEKV